MISIALMAAGMDALATAFNRPVTESVMAVYHGVIGARLTPEQWERAVRRALEAETFFPPPAALLRYGLATGSLEARAVEHYRKILDHYERGEKPGYRQISEQYGEAAAEAFMAAGGPGAFSWCEPESEPFRRRDFIKGWTETAEQEPATMLPEAKAPVGVLPSDADPLLPLVARLAGKKAF